jgi:hypothetical protein
VRGVILVSLENASFHMVHVYTINWLKKVQNINYCSHAAQPTFHCHKRGGRGRIMADLSVKGGTSERCYRTDEQRYAIISPYFDGLIKMNGPYPEIKNISSLAKLFFKTFISLKHLSVV